ncbi:MAG: phosphotransferase [Candidatus Dojkabacteria bacterium]|nr:MAG: phosphotransferase [Candidatus Dojkabacteria bacterium]
MKYDNATIRDNIVRSIETNYQIVVDTVSFIPIGEESYSYKIKGKNSQTFFAKYCAKKEIIASIDIVNELLLKLSNFEFVVPPIQIRGKTSCSVLEGKLYLFPFINGTNISLGNHDWDKTLYERIFDIMIKIHNSTHIINLNLPKETFENNFIDRLNLLVSVVGNNQNYDKQTNELLIMNETLIRKIINQHTLLGAMYKKKNLRFVLTHGDITGLNIIKTTKGMKLIDWDGAMFTPSERDLNFLSSNKHFSIKKYITETKSKHYPDLLDYYGQQWSLNSILENFEALLSSNMTNINKDDCIDEINEYLSYYK